MIVGDGAVGKTCLLISYTKDEFPTEYIPTIFDNYAANIEVNGESVSLQLWDTAGQEDYARLRPMSYPDTNVFLLAFSVDSPTSLDNITTTWYNEVHQAVPTAKVILVGTKADLREKGGPNLVQPEQIERAKEQIQAVDYIECSALTRSNVNELFNTAVLCVLHPKGTKKGKSGKKESDGKCNIY